MPELGDIVWTVAFVGEDLMRDYAVKQTTIEGIIQWRGYKKYYALGDEYEPQHEEDEFYTQEADATAECERQNEASWRAELRRLWAAKRKIIEDWIERMKGPSDILNYDHPDWLAYLAKREAKETGAIA